MLASLNIWRPSQLLWLSAAPAIAGVCSEHGYVARRLCACALSALQHDVFYDIRILFAYMRVARAQVCLIRHHCMPHHPCPGGSEKQLIQACVSFSDLRTLAGPGGAEREEKNYTRKCIILN